MTNESYMKFKFLCPSTDAHHFIYILCKATFTLKQQNYVVATDILLPTSPKILAI